MVLRAGVVVASVGWVATVGCGAPPVIESKPIGLAGGTFTMGSAIECKDSLGPVCTGDRTPHKVRISSFSLDDHEVTKGQYAQCVRAGTCPAEGAFFAGEDDYPVLVNDPEAARKFCAFRMPAMRLPTEAEFEFAQRVQPSGNLQNYAWGDDPPTCGRIPFAGCTEQAVRRVKYSPGDVSPSGIYDLAGSVPEWVEDSYTPYAGCAEHIGYGELCWNKSRGCMDARCSTDGLFCAQGCVPAPAPTAPVVAKPGMLASPQPICLLAADADLLIDPVVRGSSLFGVIRGGGPTDGACAFAGFTRRHAAAKSFAAGFRCAVSTDSSARKGTPTYRFTVDQCPPSGRLKVAIKLGAGGLSAGYSLKWFPGTATGVKSATAMNGVVEEVPCDAVLVVYPQSADMLEVKLNTIGNPNCLGGLQQVMINRDGDMPAVGLDSIKLAPANDCG